MTTKQTIQNMSKIKGKQDEKQRVDYPLGSKAKKVYKELADRGLLSQNQRDYSAHQNVGETGKDYRELRREEENANKRSLEEKCFIYDSGKIIEVDPQEQLKKRHFRYFFNSEGKEILREDFDDKGLLKEITVYNYLNNKLIGQDFYNVQLDFSRIKDSETGRMIEVDSSGKKIRTLRD